MKNNKTLLLLFVVLAGISVFYIYKTKYSTVKEELRDFAVKDTAAITKIYLADKEGNAITLTRGSDKEWKLNDEFSVRRSNILNLLEVIYKIEIRTKVAKSAYNNVIKNIASNGIKCEIYIDGKDKPEKVYYVGGQTEDVLGTFMIIENSNSPFITHIPGFNGYLTPRYSPKESNWKNPALFTYQPENISTLKLEYANFPQNSFLIDMSSGKKVSAPDGTAPLSNVDTIGVDNYLNLYSTIYYETEVTDKNSSGIDSLLATPPSITFSITDKQNKKKELFIFPMPLAINSMTQVDSTGKKLKYDPDRIYGYLQPDNILVFIQQGTISKLFRRKTDFDLNRDPSPLRK
jgi:hypothetical protein